MAGNQKVPGFPMAIGTWSDPRRRVMADQTPQKVQAFIQDKIYSMGLPVALWEEVDPLGGFLEYSLEEPLVGGSIQCSCFKDTAQQADIPCRSCYGIGRIPGYQRFGMHYIWQASISSSLVFTNTYVKRTVQPNQIEIADGHLTGSFTTPQLAIDLTGQLGNFQYQLDAYLRLNTNTITAEFSSVALSGSPVWQPITNLTSMSTLPHPYIQFRITLTRANLTDKSPHFEILRVRWPVLRDIVPTTLGGVSEPVIRVLQTWEDQTPGRTDGGARIESGGQVFFTTPLTYFDPTRSPTAAGIRNRAFIERRYGIDTQVRYPIYDLKYSEQFGIFTRQQFEIRRAQGTPGSGNGSEIYYAVF